MELLKNKRGQLAILWLVFLVLALLAGTFFSFIVNFAKTEVTIQDGKFLDNINFKENQINFYMENAGRDVLIESYRDIASEEFELESFDSEVLNNRLKEKFESSFKERLLSYTFFDPVMRDFQDKLESEEFTFSNGGGVYSLRVEDFVIIGSLVLNEGKRTWILREKPSDYEQEDLNLVAEVIYRTSFNEDFDLKVMGLHDFNEIESSIRECLGENLEECLSERLVNFDVSVTESEREYRVEMTSKNKFAIANSLQSIEIRFVIAK